MIERFETGNTSHTIRDELDELDEPDELAPHCPADDPEMAASCRHTEAETEPESPQRARVRGWIVAWVSEEIGAPAGELSTTRPLTGYGVDSLHAVQFTADAEEAFGLEIPESILWDYQTIEALAAHLADALSTGSSVCFRPR